MLEGKSRVHLVGIGGCSMNGLAQILRARGYDVKGSDRDSSPFTQKLSALGVPVYIGHQAEQVGDAEVLIYSAAIKKDNPERVYAREHGIPEIERSVALGELSAQYPDVVGIAGCHGKTTITSMLAKVAQVGALDATVHVGGDVDFLSGGTRIGKSGLLITEPCEYVESFLTLKPTVALINNIDDDHLDYYKDIEEITEAFRKFLRLLPEDGLFLGCTDDVRVKELLNNPPQKVRTISYGMADADYTPGDIRFDEWGYPSFDLMHKGENLGRITLQIPGTHNIINALAASAVSLALGESFADIKAGLAEYTLTHRRFEFYGERDGIKVYHDYAHHPAEIAAILDGASRVPHGKLYCVFQCNSYTRAKTLFLHDVNCFKLADEVLVPDIYPGREIDDGSVHAKDMVNAINDADPSKAIYLGTFETIRAYLDVNAKPGDLVLTVGSGDVYKQTRKLL